MLDELRDQGTSILLTTHQLDEAEQRCDRIVIIDHGRVIAEGTLPELIESTVGVNRRVTLRLAEPGPPPDGLPGDARTPGSWWARSGTWPSSCRGCSPGSATAGGQVSDVEVRAPSLHSVFIHLTGRELRE